MLNGRVSLRSKVLGGRKYTFNLGEEERTEKRIYGFIDSRLPDVVEEKKPNAGRAAQRLRVWVM